MTAARCFTTPGTTCPVTQCNIPEESDLHQHCCEDPLHILFSVRYQLNCWILSTWTSDWKALTLCILQYSAQPCSYVTTPRPSGLHTTTYLLKQLTDAEWPKGSWLMWMSYLSHSVLPCAFPRKNLKVMPWICIQPETADDIQSTKIFQET